MTCDHQINHYSMESSPKDRSIKGLLVQCTACKSVALAEFRAADLVWYPVPEIESGGYTDKPRIDSRGFTATLQAYGAMPASTRLRRANEDPNEAQDCVRISSLVLTSVADPTDWMANDALGETIFIRYQFGRLSVQRRARSPIKISNLYSEQIGGDTDGFMEVADMIKYTSVALSWV